MLDSTQILAVSDGGVYAMWAFNALLGVTTLVNAVTSHRTAAVVARLNRAEDARDREVATLTDKLHKASEALIDTRLRDITHKLNNHAQGLSSTLDKLALSIKETDKRIGEAELDLVKTTSAIREALVECAPTRDEHDDLKENVRELTRTVGEVTSKLITRADLREARDEWRRDNGK